MDIVPADAINFSRPIHLICIEVSRESDYLMFDSTPVFREFAILQLQPINDIFFSFEPPTYDRRIWCWHLLL
ncbi:hypothetical protein Syun_027552 [Stephania yunnanensis]|uniref:Uncharacterized protein n=1 Tax=Stephania yunnanensis TaxID=152371 RepID=A0AAP0HQB4_9MAGN